MRLAQVLTVSILTLAMAASASAERRPGLGGKYAARNMTAAQGSLTILAGPSSSQLLGTEAQGLGGAGLSYVVFKDFEEAGVSVEIDDPILFGFGGAFGITPELEAGFFLPLQLSPEFELADPTVFATYAMDMGNFDIGGRVSFSIPTEDGSKATITAGVPLLFRAGNSRIDAGIFLPITPGGKLNDDGEEAVRIDLAIPVRFTQSVTPKIYAGLETGLNLPDLNTDSGFVPVSLHGGYTLLAGGNVVDIGLSMGLPFALFLGENGPEATDIFVVRFGTNVQMKF